MLFYLGRQDRQVQIRGYRVELGDIESLLKQHPDIADAWVDVRRNAAATPLLVAFYCSVNGVALDAQQLRVWLSLRLPLHMLPLLYVPLSAMPLGVNGKIDPQCLPLVDLRQLEGPGEYVLRQPNWNSVWRRSGSSCLAWSVSAPPQISSISVDTHFC